jgi:hypothetical protein
MGNRQFLMGDFLIKICIEMQPSVSDRGGILFLGFWGGFWLRNFSQKKI